MDDHEPEPQLPPPFDRPMTQDASPIHTADEGTGHPWARPDRRLEQKIDELERRLDDLDPDSDDQRRALARARDFVTRARFELDRPSARNQEAWTWFHAARRERLALLTPRALELIATDQRSEIDRKLSGSWRQKALENYADADLVDRVTATQAHLDEAADNEHRKSIGRRNQVIGYLVVLAVTLVVLCIIEVTAGGLALADETSADGWWLVCAVLYGILGGSFSAAQRVASAPPAASVPEQRWQYPATAVRPFAGGAAALVAFAAAEAGVLGDDLASSGPRIALVAFTAGFSERFIKSLTDRSS